MYSHLRWTTVFLAACALPALSPAQSEPSSSDKVIGTLQNVEGLVLVKQGEESAPAIEGQVVRSKQQVLVTEGAKALLVFNDGCDILLEVKELYDVPDRSPCATLWWAAPAATAVICGGALAKKSENSRKIAAAGLLVGSGLLTASHNREEEERELLAALESAQGEVLAREPREVAEIVRPGSRLRAGSEVVVRKGSKARIRFDDACVKEIDASESENDVIWQVPHNSPCFRPGLWWASAAAAAGLCVAVEDEKDVSSP